MLCSSAAACGVFVFYFVRPGIWVEDEVDWCGNLTLIAGFLVSSFFLFFLFLFCIWITHILDLVCTKHIYFLNVIVHR
jgi:hypothetical protein